MEYVKFATIALVSQLQTGNIELLRLIDTETDGYEFVLNIIQDNSMVSFNIGNVDVGYELTANISMMLEDYRKTLWGVPQKTFNKARFNCVGTAHKTTVRYCRDTGRVAITISNGEDTLSVSFTKMGRALLWLKCIVSALNQISSSFNDIRSTKAINNK